MRALVVYDSTYGNTEAIARAVADGLAENHSVRVLRAAIAQPSDVAWAELLVVGAPTQRHRVSEAMAIFLDKLPKRSLHNVSAASFDTRYRLARWLTGSAGLDIKHGLARAGAILIDEPQSFFMEADQPPKGEKRRHELEKLAPGEVERARVWASGLLAPALEKAISK